MHVQTNIHRALCIEKDRQTKYSHVDLKGIDTEMYKRRLTISLFLPLKRALTQDNDGRLPNIAVHLHL
jgi:hypothetical protein